MPWAFCPAFFFSKVALKPANEYKNWQSVGISVFTDKGSRVAHFFVTMQKGDKLANFLNF
jgi:hypothetical protein